VLRTDRFGAAEGGRLEVLHFLRAFHPLHGVGALVEDLILVTGDLGLRLDALRPKYFEWLVEFLAAEIAVVRETVGGEHLRVAAGLALVVADRFGGGNLGVGKSLFG
jgi:hypothetical protein